MGNINNIRPRNTNNKKRYCITNNFRDSIKDNIEDVKYTINFSPLIINKYFEIAKNIFEEFSSNGKSFYDTAIDELNENNINFEIFKKAITTLLLIRNYCEQFDKIKFKRNWEILCNDITPIYNKKMSEIFILRKNNRTGKISFISKNNLVKVIKPENINGEFHEVFKNIRNAIAHGKFSLVCKPNKDVKVYITDNNVLAEVDTSFFITGMGFDPNSKTKSWNHINLDNINEITKAVNDLINIDNLHIKFERCENSGESSYINGQLYTGDIPFSTLKTDVENNNKYRKTELYLDKFQKKILIKTIKNDIENFNSLSDEDKKIYIYNLIYFIYYGSYNGNNSTMILQGYVATLANNPNMKKEDFNNKWRKNQKFKSSLVGLNNKFDNLNIENASEVFKRLYLKYHFIKQEWIGNNLNMKIHRHLRNCFIHENYTHLPIGEIGFRDHRPGNRYDVTFKGNCKLDELYNCIINQRPIDSIFEIDLI